MRKPQKEIIFLEVDSSYSHSMLSYGYLRAYTEKMQPGWGWSHLVTTINDDCEKLLLETIDASPSVLCSTLYLFNHEYTVRLIKKLKRLLPKCMIFLGGPEFLGGNEVFLRSNPEVDAVIRGDESSFHLLLPCLGDKDKWENIPGLCFLRINRYFDYGTARFADTENGLDVVPSPYEKGYFTPGRPFYQIETSRGCRGKCSFCTSALSKEVACFGVSRVKEDLETLSGKGVGDIRIVDRTFNEDRNRSRELLKIFRLFPQTRFHLEINPALADDDLLSELSLFKPGKLHIEAGIQTFSLKSCQAVRRYGSPSKMLTGLKRLCRLENADVHTDLIAGLPGQTFKDVMDDVRTLVRLNPHEIQLENLKILPGTEFSSNPPSGTVWNPLPPYEVLRTKTMSPDHLHAAKHLSKLLDSYFNTPKLKNLFRFAFIRDGKFIGDFLKYLEDNSDPMQKHHLDKRIHMIADYAAGKDKTLAEFAIFVWLASGLPPDQFAGYTVPLKTVKIKNGINCDSSEGESIYVSSGDIAPSKVTEAVLNFNAGDIWLKPESRLEQGRFTYRFFSAHGGRITKIASV